MVPRKTELSACAPILQETELTIARAYVMKTRSRFPSGRAWRASRAENTSTGQEGGVPQRHRDRRGCNQDLSRPCPIFLFIWRVICILYNIFLYYKRGNTSKVFLGFRASQSEVPMTTWNLRLTSKVGGGGWGEQACGTEPLNCGIVSHSG